jgi:hypothetical protein
VSTPRVRDGVGQNESRIRFTSAILPPYARRSKSLEVLIPMLYLKGVSTGDFEEALSALLGKEAVGLSASTIARLRTPGRMSIYAGRSVIYPPNTTFICRPHRWGPRERAILARISARSEAPRTDDGAQARGR